MKFFLCSEIFEKFFRIYFSTVVLYRLHIPQPSRIHVSVRLGKTSILGQKQGFFSFSGIPVRPCFGSPAQKDLKGQFLETNPVVSSQTGCNMRISKIKGLGFV
jgi:hypothetical protein